ncbi:hypothetical protein Sste5346_007498 [Sporothrix stenoceras]|uniref:Ketopantoate reductase C-terminal domain-containing protein n=1 Tax=Sporothrix stenoceras TaxID=5173 RepID=A0ABR3YVF5_9PEZI
MSCVHSIRAFESIAHRINHRTTICLVQGGLGVAERLNELYFPDIPSRPTYLLAHMTHSLGYTDRPFTVVELEPGRMVFTRYTPADQIAEEVGPASTADHDFDADSATAAAEDDRDFDAIISDGENGASSRAPPQFVPELPPAQEMEFDSDEVLELERNNGMRLMYLLGVTPELGAGGYSIAAYLRYKLPELVYTAAVEPVATALDLAVSNAFWSNGHACSIMEDLVAEMVEVIKHLPETRSSKRLSDYVNSGELERKVHRMSFSLAHKEGRLLAPASNVVAASYSEVGETWGNKAPAQDPGSDVFCLMARRTALGQRTDIEFLNGYFVRRGKALGIACPMNEMIIKMVRAKRKDSMARPYNQVYPGSLGRPTPIPFVTPKGPFTPAAGKFGASPDSGYQEFLKDHEEQQRQQYGRDHEIGNEEEDQYSENWA